MLYNDIEYVKGFRKTEHEIDPLILRRWSPRAMNGKEISEEALMSLFEAARWAPSASNIQPWRFLYVKNYTVNWTILFNLLNDINQTWAKNASVLIAVLSEEVLDGGKRNNQTASFDAGAAWQNIALQASSLGLVSHAMSGFDHDKARIDLSLPDGYNIHAIIAIGHPGDKENLSEALQAREEPSDRKFISEFIREGRFSF